jgi:hypothetical protein
MKYFRETCLYNYQNYEKYNSESFKLVKFILFLEKTYPKPYLGT